MNIITLFIIQRIKKDKISESSVSSANKIYVRNEVSRESNEWYIGGNLHQLKVKEWKSATDENKMATCADFVMKMKPNISINEANNYTLNLKNCIDEATFGSDYTNEEKITQIAAMCAIILDYQ